MTRVVVMTIYDRPEEVLRAVFAGLSLPGNTPDALVVCYDRASGAARRIVEAQCSRLGIRDLRQERLDGHFSDGPRCPSLAWNTALALVKEDHAFCISSEMVLAPHSVGMAFHLAATVPDVLIVGRAEHCGQSYFWTPLGEAREDLFTWRIMTWHQTPKPLGFNWLLPMKAVRAIHGYDEAFMHGFCYEDSDFVVRLWRHGTDFVFCDDIVGFHLEHRRDHLLDKDGKVLLNEKLFTSRYGNKNYLEDLQLKPIYSRCDVALGFWTHDKSNRIQPAVSMAQRLYCNDAPWRAAPVADLSGK